LGRLPSCRCVPCHCRLLPRITRKLSTVINRRRRSVHCRLNLISSWGWSSLIGLSLVTTNITWIRLLHIIISWLHLGIRLLAKGTLSLETSWWSLYSCTSWCLLDIWLRLEGIGNMFIIFCTLVIVRWARHVIISVLYLRWIIRIIICNLDRRWFSWLSHYFMNCLINCLLNFLLSIIIVIRWEHFVYWVLLVPSFILIINIIIIASSWLSQAMFLNNFKISNIFLRHQLVLFIVLVSHIFITFLFLYQLFDLGLHICIPFLEVLVLFNFSNLVAKSLIFLF